MLWQSLTLQLGYNATLVTIGATLLGLAAGLSGTYLYLRKNPLVSDAISHATLPGLGIAFIIMAMFGGSGRFLPGLLIGSAISAGLGLWCVSLLVRKTRLSQDAAIGAVLSTFFSFGVVILTLIQSMPFGNQAGLQSFLLGSTAGMLWNDALVIAVLALAVTAILILFRRPMRIVAFDETYAQALGYRVGRVDAIILGVTLTVTVIGMSVVGLILIVALLIIPAVAARFWSEKSDVILKLSGLFGGISGYFGATLSGFAPNLPAGPIIVLVAFAIFVVSFLLAPERGVLAASLRFWSFQSRVHLTQGLLALAQDRPIYEPRTRRLLIRRGYIRGDDVPTALGRQKAMETKRNEARWAYWKQSVEGGVLSPDTSMVHSLIDIEARLTQDQIAEIDEALAHRGAS